MRNFIVAALVALPLTIPFGTQAGAPGPGDEVPKPQDRVVTSDTCPNGKRVYARLLMWDQGVYNKIPGLRTASVPVTKGFFLDDKLSRKFGGRLWRCKKEEGCSLSSKEHTAHLRYIRVDSKENVTASEEIGQIDYKEMIVVDLEESTLKRYGAVSVTYPCSDVTSPAKSPRSQKCELRAKESEWPAGNSDCKRGLRIHAIDRK